MRLQVAFADGNRGGKKALRARELRLTATGPAGAIMAAAQKVKHEAALKEGEEHKASKKARVKAQRQDHEKRKGKEGGTKRKMQ